MIIPAGTILRYKNYPLEMLGKELWLNNPVAICSVMGKYVIDSNKTKHYEHFESSQDVNRWLRDKHIIIRDDTQAYLETLAIGDGLASLVLAAEKVHATKAYIRSVGCASDPLIVPGEINYHQQIIATIYAALYK